MINYTGNPNYPTYNENEWETTGEIRDGYGVNESTIKCINKETGEVFWFQLSEVCGF